MAAIPRGSLYGRLINPSTGRPVTSRTSNATLIRGEFNEAVQQVLTVSMQDLVSEAAATANEQAAEAMILFSRSLRNQYARNRTSELTNMHRVVAEDAQRSMLGSYDRIVGQRSLGEYRSRVARKEWKRYSGGQLRRALARPDFYRVSYDGILWANMTMLDKRAAQWYRLNYGAGARGAGHRASQALPSAKMKFFNQTLSSSLLPTTFKPSAPYMIPRGVFADIDQLGVEPQGRFKRVQLSSIRGGRKVRGSPAEFGVGGRSRGESFDRAESRNSQANFFRTAFHPVGYVNQGGWDVTGIPRVGPKITRGFAGAFFIEAGLVRMSKTLPAAYEKQALKWFTEAAKTETGPISKIINVKRAERLMNVVSLDIDRLSRQRQLGAFLRRL